MASVTNCLDQIQELTRKNLEILQTLNDSFFTKQNHLAVNIGENQYVIPSFISCQIVACHGGNEGFCCMGS